VASGESQAPQVLLVHGADPLGASHLGDDWKKALEKIPLVVSFSPFLDETTSYADVIIPELLPWERWQDAPTPPSYPYPAWGVARPLVTPPDGPTHVGETLFALARTLGGSMAGSLPYESFEDLLRSRGRGLFEASRGGTFAPAFETENRRQREARGWWLPGQPDFDSFWSELVDRGGWVDPFYDFADPGRFARTPDHRIALLPAAVVESLASDGSKEQLYAPEPDRPEAEGGAFPLRLLPYRVSTLASDTLCLERWLAEQPAVFPDTQWIPWVSIAPETAAEMGLSANGMVRIVSPRGAYEARLRISVGIAPRTAVVPIGPRHPDGRPANPLRILDDSVDRLTGLPAWFTTRVRLEPLQRGG